MLITPGIITDLLGLSLIFPLTRIFYARIALAWFKKKFQSGVINVSQGSFDPDMHFNQERPGVRVDAKPDDNNESPDSYQEGEIIDVPNDRLE